MRRKCPYLVIVCKLAFVLSATGADWNTNDAWSINWGAQCGVPGGIPNRTTIYTNLSSAQVGGSSTVINNALVACPSNQVVLLGSGTFSLAGSIAFASLSGKTLRGGGMGATLLSFTGAGGSCLNSDEYGYSTASAMSSGYTKGSTSVVMTAALDSGFQPGRLIQFRQNDNTNFVYASGGPAKHMQYAHRILTTNGTTITFEPPMMFTLTAGNSPDASFLAGISARRCSIENLSILNTGTRDDGIQWKGGDQCWFTGLQISNMTSSAIFLYDSVQCSITRNYIHHARDFPNNADGYGVTIDGVNNTIDGTSSFNLVEDNIFYEVFVAMWPIQSSGNAFIFNFCTNGGNAGFSHQGGIMNAGHGAHPMMTLWEGDIGEQWQHDGYHGSASHQTVFRCWIHGEHPTYADNRKMIDLCRGTYTNVVVGNVLGNAAWTPDEYTMTGQPDYSVGNVIRRLGYPNVASNGTDPGDVGNPWAAPYPSTYPDAKVAASLEWTHNYDFKNAAIVNSTSGVPNSIFYAAKPASWGDMPWPAFDPGSPSATSSTNIPAGRAYALGYPYTNWPPAAAGGGGGGNGHNAAKKQAVTGGSARRR